VVNGRVLDSWGLHIVDMNLAMGNLLEIVREEGRAYVTTRRQ
jgi:hypothetical protein